MRQAASQLLIAALSALILIALFFTALHIAPMPSEAAPNLQYVTRDSFWRFLDDAGDGTGLKNITGTYAITSDIFYIEPPGSQVYVLSRMLVEIEDDVSALTGTLYGGATITNGIAIRKQDDTGTLIDYTDGVSITNNAGWARFCIVNQTAFSTGNNFLRVECDFSKTGALVRLNGAKNERLEVVANDDFSSLVGHRFLVQGFQE